MTKPSENEIKALLEEIDIRIAQAKDDYEHDKTVIYQILVPLVFSYIAISISTIAKYFPEKVDLCCFFIVLGGLAVVGIFGYALVSLSLRKQLIRLKKMHEYIQGLFSVKISLHHGKVTKREAKAFDQFINQYTTTNFSELMPLSHFLKVVGEERETKI